MITKMPGWLFSAYQSTRFFSQQLISEEQYQEIVEDWLLHNPGARDKYNAIQKQSNFTNNIPKYKMWVKLSPNVTQERADFIANGIRSYFKDDRTVLLDVRTSLAGI